MVIEMWRQGGMDALDTQQVRNLRAAHKFPHQHTCDRWIRLYQETGNVLPKRHTGNKHSEREIFGQDLVNLALFRLVRPKAYIQEVAAYVHRRNPANRPYSLAQIHRAERRLGLWKKVASSTSNEAYRPLNLSRRAEYWQQSYPAGVHDQDTARMIDIDEAGFTFLSKDRKRGKVTKQRRADARGNFKKGGGRVNLLMGISGDSQDPFEFHKLITEGGTDLWRFYCFMEDFIEWLSMNRQNEQFCFTMDNLNIHKHPVILDLIEQAGHRVVFRAPYWSCDGPIEYVFNTIHVHLQMTEAPMNDIEDLKTELDDIIFRLVDASFNRYFRHVGFP